ncbi:hypothetical protein [Pseudomonas auratipiscis]|uniref:Uncharacterized protein n=1 Tax=Pseudomonas auratipiscis TaxID=3115853 RepID=A0AB35WV61_9PSED|nr:MULTISPECIES: hypothetical protein [unclassified Pseudomonas]MEE1867006.1 hypothetical protein [Pseudomonas sp. 120P]MEE1957833.1 hypothetical protein [Pseudomonas sp. 119P]
MGFLNWLLRRSSSEPVADDTLRSASVEKNVGKEVEEKTESKQDFSETNKALAAVWNDVGVVSSTVKAGTVLYSGLRSRSSISDVKALIAKQGSLWLSQSAFYAAEYCYRDMGTTAVRFLIKVKLSSDLEVLRFPDSFNPADSFVRYERNGGAFSVNYSESLGLRRDGAPDHHIVKHFKEIAGFQGLGVGCVGHVRYAINDELGAVPSEIIELFTYDLDSVEVLDLMIPPDTKDNFKGLIGDPLSSAGEKLFPD